MPYEDRPPGKRIEEFLKWLENEPGFRNRDEAVQRMTEGLQQLESRLPLERRMDFPASLGRTPNGTEVFSSGGHTIIVEPAGTVTILPANPSVTLNPDGSLTFVTPPLLHKTGSK